MWMVIKLKNIKIRFAIFLIIPLLFILFFTVAIVQFITITNMSKNLEDQQRKIFQNITLAASEELKQNIKEIMNQIEILSTFPKMKSLSYDNQESKQEVISYFKSILNIHKSNIQYIFFGFNSNGKLLIYPNAKLPSDYDARKRPWFKEALNKPDKVFLSSIYVDVITKQLVTSVSKAVKDGNNIIGVIGADISLKNFGDELLKIKIGKSGYIVVLSSDGKVLIHPDKTRIGTDSVLKPYLNKIKSEKQGFIDYVYKGKEKTAFYRYDDFTNLIYFSALEKEEIQNIINSTRHKAIVVTIIISIFVIVILLIFSLYILSSFKKINIASKNLSDGNLNAYIKDSTIIKEISDVINEYNIAISKILNTVKSIQKNANIVNSTAMNLFAISQEISSSSEEISSSTDQLAQGMSEIAESLTNLLNLQKSFIESFEKLENVFSNITNLAKNTINYSKNGEQKLTEVVNISNTFFEQFDTMKSLVDEFAQKTFNIETIIQTIKSISDQTNLLALNASIEAAKAGESGKGFSVVAYEIRKLAEQSKDSLKIISNMINEIKAKLSEIIETTERITEKSTVQLESINQTVSDLKLIINSIYEISPEINNAVSVLTSNKELTSEITTSVERITAVTQQTAASAQEIAAASHEVARGSEEIAENAQSLTMVSNSLVESTKFFKT